jgi:HK97 gp10 family phage protein
MAQGFRIVVNEDASGLIGEALSKHFATELGPRIQANARRTVPVLSGDLKDSIVVQVKTGTEPVLQVGVDEDIKGVDYGRYVEEGTSKQAAQPYLRPALYQARG